MSSTSPAENNEASSAMTKLAIYQRLMSLPLLQAAVEQALKTYTTAKESIPVLSSALNLTESTVSRAVSVAGPVVQKIDAPIRMADGIACSAFDMVEKKFPAIKTTPEEARQICEYLYQQKPLIKAGVDYAVSIKDVASKMVSTILVRFPCDTREKAEELVNVAFQQTVTVFQLMSAIAANTVDATSASVHSAASQASKLVSDVLKFWDNTSVNVSVLYSVQLFASYSDLLFQRVTGVCTPLLPEAAQKPLAKASSVVSNFSDTVLKAKSLDEVKGEVFAQASSALEAVQHVFMEAVDVVAEYPPLNSLGVNLEGTVFEPDVLVIDRDLRLPESSSPPPVHRPVIEPRLPADAQMG